LAARKRYRRRAALAPGGARARLDLNLLFIEPGQYRRAASAEPLLAHTAAVAQGAGAERLAILADLNAAGSYERFRGVPGYAAHRRRAAPF